MNTRTGYWSPIADSMMVFIMSNWADRAEDNSVPQDWAGELAYPNNIGFDRHFQLYTDMVNWIRGNIGDCDNSARWTKLGDCIYVQFKYQQDMSWFALRFGTE